MPDKCSFCDRAGHITRADSEPPIWWCSDCWIDYLREVGPLTLVPAGNTTVGSIKRGKEQLNALKETQRCNYQRL